MTGLGSTVSNLVLDLVFRGVPYPYTPGTMVSLHTADPGDTGAGEVLGGSYARQSALWSSASGGQIILANAIDFNGMPATTVTHFGVWTAFGQFVGSGTLPSTSVLSGDSIRLQAGTVLELVAA